MLLEFNQITYTYPCGQKPAIQDFTLTVPEDQLCVLIGRNGCGKTTLFSLANGLYRPQKGRIRAFDQPLQYTHQALNQLRQKIGLVFQNPEQQLVATTVEEDLSYGLLNFGYSEQEVRDRVQQALLDFDLIELADTPINSLSLGQKKRVAIADVMILRPQLLLLDEPTAYLDPYQTQNFIQVLERIRATGTTVIIATHNLNFAYTYADWIWVMDQGQLRLEGTPEAVFNQTEVMNDLKLGRPFLLDLLEQIPGTKMTPIVLKQLFQGKYSEE